MDGIGIFNKLADTPVNANVQRRVYLTDKYIKIIGAAFCKRNLFDGVNTPTSLMNNIITGDNENEVKLSRDCHVNKLKGL